MQKKVVGKSIRDLTKEEMEKVYGTNGEVEAQISPLVVSAARGGGIVSWVASKAIC